MSYFKSTLPLTDLEIKYKVLGYELPYCQHLKGDGKMSQKVKTLIQEWVRVAFEIMSLHEVSLIGCTP